MHNNNMRKQIMPVRATEHFQANHMTDNHFLDNEGCIRDMFVEQMFQTLFEGGDITETFRHNMRLYMEIQLGHEDVPDEFFEDADYAIAYIRAAWGLMHVEAVHEFADEDFDHCTHQAVLRSPLCHGEPIYTNGPARLNAALLGVVVLLRKACDAHFAKLIEAEEHGEE